MTIELATVQDLQIILEIFSFARAEMKKMGNTSQWQDNYPSQEVLLNDINNQNCFICREQNSILGTFACIRGVDSTYLKIVQGNWINEDPYITIHRIASNRQIKGLGRRIIQWCFQQHPNIRIDTHTDNKPMQHILDTENFVKCGIIYTDDGTPRIAYQKTI